MRSIQNQNYDNIEIILIDDYSEDNTIKVIENYQKDDKRIILIRHKNNKGTLISRNEGILISKGNYIIIPDIDDILSKNILNQCFIQAEINNYDMIRFNMYLDNKNIFMYSKIKNKINKAIYQPTLSSFIFYGTNHLEIIDPMISNKFIKRNILIKSLNSIDNFYLSQNMIFYEDTLINFMLYKVSQSCYYSKNIGYLYISNPNSSTKRFIGNEIYVNKLLISFFLFLKYIFNNTKNTKYEKSMVEAVLEKEFKVILNSNYYNKINNNYQFYIDILNLYLENKYIKLSIKNRLIIIKKIIEKNYFKNSS